MLLSCLKRYLVRSKALRCKYALKLTCGIKNQVLGNPPSSASFAETVRPKQQNSLSSTKYYVERSIVNQTTVQCMTLSHAVLNPTPESESVRLW